MHPLVARLHPAFRTAVTAWLLSRILIWVSAPSHLLELADGAPLPGLVATFVDAATATVPPGIASDLVAFGPWIFLEAAVLTAGIAVYHFARATELPQFAERACWLWFFNPIWAVTAGNWGAQTAAACGALAVAAMATHRPRRAIVAAVIATGCRLEFIVLWPAIALAAWRHRRDERHTTTTLAAALIAVPVAFAAWIATALHLAGSAGTSMRSIHGDRAWRDSLSMVDTPTVEWIVIGALTVAIAVCLYYVRRFPAWYALAALPPLIWPLVQTPAITAAVTTCWALPAFVYFATATDDRSIERPLLATLIVAFAAAAFTL